MRNPIESMKMKVITSRVKACLILHNMCVSDRVMDGDVRAVYKPTNVLVRRCPRAGADEEEDGGSSSRAPSLRSNNSMMLGEEDVHVGTVIENVNRRWSSAGDALLTDPAEHARLHTALLNKYD